jgi:hypothetical protein
VIAPMIATAANLADEVDEQDQLVDRLRREPGTLGSVLRGRARRDHCRLLLFVDQFEELYTLAQVADPEERAAFTACLAAVADDATSPLRVVLSIRSEFLDRIAENPQFAGELSRGLFFLGRPGRENLREAITQPAELAGFQFELPAIVDDMLDVLETTPGALPLLQFAAARLWETRDIARKLLTQQSYAAMGGVAGALASHADRVVADLGAHRASLIRALLLRLVTPERTRAIVPLAELRALSGKVGEVQRLIDQMVDARLLVVQNLGRGRRSTVEIVHESLVQSWPTLRRWLDEDQDDAALVDQLRVAARQWQFKHFDAGLLWRGDAAAEVRRFCARYQGPLSEMEHDFLDAVLDHEAAQVRRKRTVIITGLAALSMIAIATLVLLVFVQQSRTAARDNTARAIAQQHLAEERLEQKEKADRARVEAEKAETVAVHETQVVTKEKAVVATELDKSKEELIKERDNANANALAAQRAQRRADENAHKTARSENEATAAREATAQANRDLQKALDKEEKRRAELEKTIGSKLIEDLKPFIPKRPQPRRR